MSAQVLNLFEGRGTDQRFIFSPAPRVLSHDVGGCTIRFCPATEDWGHGLGITRITPLAWYDRERDGTLVIKARGSAKMSAEEIVKFFLGDDGRSGDMGRAGLRPMSGEPEKDALIRAEAQKAWAEKTYFDARNKVRAHESAIDKARVAGTEAPGYSKDIDDAYRTKADYERQGYAPAATHPCPVCMAPAYTDAERSIHLRDVHGQAEKKEPATDVAMIGLLTQLVESQAQTMARITKLEEKPKRGRPPKAKEA